MKSMMFKATCQDCGWFTEIVDPNEAHKLGVAHEATHPTAMGDRKGVTVTSEDGTITMPAGDR